MKLLFVYKFPVTISDTQIGDTFFCQASKRKGEIWEPTGLYPTQDDDTDAT